jgi:hypothetical protein
MLLERGNGSLHMTAFQRLGPDSFIVSRYKAILLLRPASHGLPTSPRHRQLTRAHPNWESSVLEAANQLHGSHTASQSPLATLINPARCWVTALPCMQGHGSPK